MTDIESTLSSIDCLIRESEEGKLVEKELRPIVLDLIRESDKIPQESYDKTKDLFIRIAGIVKSTYFAGEFYKRMQDSNLPFSQKVFEKAVYDEPYYNCQGEALSGYLITILKNNGYKNTQLFDYIKENYLENELPKDLPKKEDIRQKDYEDVKKALAFGFKTDKHHYMTHAALRGILGLNMSELTEELESTLKRYITGMERFSDQDTDISELGSSNEALNSSRIAFTLFRLTKKEEFKKIYRMLDGERMIMASAACGNFPDYHLRYAEVHKKITELL